MYRVDQVALPLAQRMLQCLDSAVDELESKPKHRGLMPGRAAVFLATINENICCDGLAWVLIVSSTPEDTDRQRCGVLSYTVVLEIGIARCAPPVAIRTIPPMDVYNTATELQMADYAAMSKAICCYQATSLRRTLEGPWAPLDVQGACMGGTMTLTALGIPACNCKELESP